MKLAGSVLAAMLMVLPCLAQNAVSKQALTAQDVVERIKSQAGIAWLAETRDTFKAGDPQTPVTGIAVTMMATYAVLQRAVANGQNLIITH
jgi:putative NIF3 family GTP cyclohydrolase 1 type 2